MAKTYRFIFDALDNDTHYGELTCRNTEELDAALYPFKYEIMSVAMPKGNTEE